MNPTASDVGIDVLDIDWRVDAELDVDQHARLEGLLDGLRDGLLEDALSSVVGNRSGHLCLRHLDVAPLSVRWSAPDTELLDAWSTAIARAVNSATRQPGEDFVAYPNVSSARRDLVVSVLRGDRSRMWAWQLLGLWPSSSGSDAEAVALTVMTAATDQPAATGALFVDIARTGHLSRALDWLGETRFADVARRAWHAAGGTTVGRTRDPSQVGAPMLADAVVEALVALVARRSDVFAAFAAAGVAAPRLRAPGSVVTVTPGVAPAPRFSAYADGIARLAVLEVEPAAAGWPVGVAAVGRLASRLSRGTHVDGQSERGISATPRPGTTRGGGGVGDDLGVAGRARPTSAQDADGTAPEHRTAKAERAGSERDEVVLERTEHVDEPPPTTQVIRPGSAWGGLLFMLRVVDELDLPARVLADPTWFGVGLRGRLHLLGRELVRRAAPDAEPVRPDDPAILAFCGLRVDDAPPVDDGAPREWLDAEVGEIVETLRRRLRDSTGTDRVEQALLVSLLRRRARIDGAPGWIDVELDLDEVTIDVRRAGLDLDPGYLPWLGAVVRFCYV